MRKPKYNLKVYNLRPNRKFGQWTLAKQIGLLQSKLEQWVMAKYGFVAYWRPWTALTVGVGCDAVGTWHGVPDARLVSREPCSHRLGL